MKDVFIGKVVSAKNLKTVVVEVTTRTMHPLYHKATTKNKNYKAHDELGVKEGEWVKVAQCKPYSKDKHWKVIERVKQ